MYAPPPVGSTPDSKKTILKMACAIGTSCSVLGIVNFATELTETKVPGRKSIVTVDILKMGVSGVDSKT